MLTARRGFALALVLALGAACAQSSPSHAGPESEGQAGSGGASPPLLCSAAPDTCGLEGGQTGSGGASPPYRCSQAPDACPAHLWGALAQIVGTLGDRPGGVRSRCVAASSLDSTLSSEASVCHCDYSSANAGGQYNGFAPYFHDVGLVGARLAATGGVGDSCEVRRTYVTDSVCLFESAEFSGCSPTQPRSCAEPCEQIRLRHSAEVRARLRGIELSSSSCGKSGCDADFRQGAFRIGDRCYNAHLGDPRLGSQPSPLGEVSCELPLEDVRSSQLSAEIILDCPDAATPPPYCLRGEAPSVVVSDPERGIRGMALDATHLYWHTDSAIFRQPKAGGLAEKVIDVLVDAQGLTSDASRLYWQSPPVLFSLPIEGGTEPVVLLIDANVPGGWTVSGSRVYYLSDRNSLDGVGQFWPRSPSTVTFSDDDIPELELRSIATSGGTSLALASRRGYAAGLVADPTGLYWMQRPLWHSLGGGLAMPPAIEKYTFADQSVSSFANGGFGSDVLTAGNRVLWGSYGLEWSSSPDGSESLALASVPGLLTSDGTLAYWTSSPGGGNIAAVPLTGGALQLSSCVVFTPASLLADESALYYLSRRGDLIARLPKPLVP